MANMVETIFLATECLALGGVIPRDSILIIVVFEYIVSEHYCTSGCPNDGILDASVTVPN